MRNILALLLCLLTISANAAEPTFAEVGPGTTLTFPRDHGAHNEFRTEWWYATGHLTTASGKPLGFQVTFFGSRTGIGEDSKSSFAPSQILFAHAAIADPAYGKLRHDEKISRSGFGAHAKTDTLDVKLDRWSMRLDGERILTNVRGKDFAFDLVLTQTRAPLLQGENGVSRKGPVPQHASYYVSMVQLAVTGSVTIGGKTENITGVSWFDHEWSSEYLASDAQGWDWLGANFDDGGALMAFRMRAKNGGALWAAATRVFADGKIVKMWPDEVEFTPLRTWRSPRTGASWPVEMNVRVGAETFTLKPWMDDQELDSARSTGITYWEGATDVLVKDKRVARGYLELTGYAKPIKF